MESTKETLKHYHQPIEKQAVMGSLSEGLRKHKTISIPDIWKDLRIGNWLSFKGMWVERVDSISIGIIQFYGINGFFSPEIGLQGILLNEYWLDAFGAKKTTREMIGLKKKNLMDCFLIPIPNQYAVFKVEFWKESESWSLSYCIVTEIDKPICKIEVETVIGSLKCVHDLQNMIYYYGQKQELFIGFP
jgi:hypothetical protein